MKTNRKILIILCNLLIFVNFILVACSGATATPAQTTGSTATFPPVDTATPEIIATPTPTFTVPPTFTPFRAPPTATATPRPTATLTPTRTATPTPVIAPTATPATATLAGFGKISFRAAYSQGLSLAGSKLDNRASLVLAQINLATPERPIWTFYLVRADINQMWTLIYDPGNNNISVLSNQKPILVADAGQIDLNRLIDSPDIVRRVLARGFPPQTPVDTIYIQMNSQPTQTTPSTQPRFAVYTLINSTFNKQLVVNAYTGDIVQNTFTQ